VASNEKVTVIPTSKKRAQCLLINSVPREGLRMTSLHPVGKKQYIVTSKTSASCSEGAIHPYRRKTRTMNPGE
jgi:hypothetical protein